MGFSIISPFNGPFNGQQKHGLLNRAKDGLKSVSCEQILNKALTNPPPPRRANPIFCHFLKNCSELKKFWSVGRGVPKKILCRSATACTSMECSKIATVIFQFHPKAVTENGLGRPI